MWTEQQGFPNKVPLDYYAAAAAATTITTTNNNNVNANNTSNT